MPTSKRRRHKALTPSVKFLNGEVHDWYRMVLGYPDHLVTSLFDRLAVDESSRVLDPFCGSGTTLVECMKRSVRSAGIDANPVAVMASRAKTDWSLDPERLVAISERVARRAATAFKSQKFTSDPTYEYLAESGMMKRGWITARPLRKAIAVKRSLGNDSATRRYKDLLQLCLLAEVVRHASNVKFGPEIFCSKKKRDAAVFGGFLTRVRQAAKDLETVKPLSTASSPTVVEGDARGSSRLLGRRTFTHCVCSPPYPTEHDYTRNSRLELAFLERGTDRDSLRAIKKAMIRSHTKNIYKGDTDYDCVKDHEAINRLVARLRKEVGDAHGFVGYYPEVVAQYFGGMKKHFKDLKSLLVPGARCAYVVGDQSSYCGIHIPTAKLLGSILDSLGFIDIEIVHWRGRWSSATSVMVDENVLLFSAKGRA